MATVLIAFLVIMFLGVPLALAMGAAGLIGLGNLNIVVMAQQLFVGLNSFTMIAIPLFIFMGNLMTDSGLTEKLINFCNSLSADSRVVWASCPSPPALSLPPSPAPPWHPPHLWVLS